MERDLKFLKTMSVAEFKALHNVEKIEVKRKVLLFTIQMNLFKKCVPEIMW